MWYDAVQVARGMVRRSRRGARVDMVQSCEISVYKGQRHNLRITGCGHHSDQAGMS